MVDGRPARVRHPGHIDGPCRDDQCGHARCKGLRLEAASPCGWCGRAIGYNTPYFIIGGKPTHDDCDGSPRARAERLTDADRRRLREEHEIRQAKQGWFEVWFRGERIFSERILVGKAPSERLSRQACQDEINRRIDSGWYLT